MKNIKTFFQELHGSAAIPAESRADIIAFAVSEPELLGGTAIFVSPARPYSRDAHRAAILLVARWA